MDKTGAIAESTLIELTNVAHLTLDIIDAAPDLPVLDGVKIAVALDALGYCKPTF